MRGLALRAFVLVLQIATIAAWSQVRGATIAYSSPTLISGAGDVLGAGGGYGSLMDAKNLGGGSAVTINAVSFAAATTQNTDAGGTFGGFYSGSTGDAGLDNLLTTGAFSPTFTPVVLTLNGLTIGDAYRIQMFFVDDRPGFLTQMTVDGSVEVPLVTPHSLVGIFTADATSQQITIVRSTLSTGGQSQLNGYALFGPAVPEPSSFVLAGIGAIALLTCSRRSRDRG